MIKSAIVAFSLLMAGVASAQAAPVSFDMSSNSQARKIVNILFADYLSARTGIQVGTAVKDLDGDGVGEIFIRFIHTGSCLPGLKVCRTAVAHYDTAKGWQIVLDRNVETMEVLPGKSRYLAPIKTDTMVWKYSYPSYKPDFSTMGQPLVLSPLPDSIVPQVAPAFGPGAAKLSSEPGNLKFDYAQPDLGGGNKALFVKMSGDAICGTASGCPMRMLVKTGTTWSTVLTASSQNDVALGPISRGGYHDVVLSTKDGAVVMGWNGKSYSIADRAEASIVEKRK